MNGEGVCRSSLAKLNHLIKVQNFQILEQTAVRDLETPEMVELRVEKQ